MKLTEKLDKMMHDKGINKNTLSKESGLPYSTIRSLYVNGSDNIKLSTLKTLCEYFNCSADYLVFDDLTEYKERKKPVEYVIHDNNSDIVVENTPIPSRRDTQALFDEMVNSIVDSVYKEAERRWAEKKEVEKDRYIATPMAGEAK